MARQSKKKIMPQSMGCCRVDAVVNVDERGQIVLPKEVRERIGVKAGDKFVIIGFESCGRTGCLFLIKAEDFGEIVKDFLGPVVKDILQ